MNTNKSEHLELTWNVLEHAYDTKKDVTHAIRYISKPEYVVDCTLNANNERGIIINCYKEEVNPFSEKLIYVGFELRSQKSIDNSGYELEIIVSDSRYNDIFGIFCRDLLNKIEILNTTSEIKTAVIKHLELWQNFIAEVRNEILSENEIKGLFGELYFLLNTLIPNVGVREAIDSWKGPQRKPQDFTFRDIGVEVKTSSDKEQTAVRITNEPQLNNTGFAALYLYYIRLVETGCGNPTLNTLVDKIYDACSEYPEAWNKFSRDLIGCHYYEKDREYYDKTGFAIGSETPYIITDDFPCLTRVKYLPDWVSDVKYSIKLDAIKPYIVSKDDFKKSLGGN